MPRVSVAVNSSQTAVLLDKSIVFDRMRVTKAYINNSNMGNADAMLYFRVNEYSNNRYGRNGTNDIMYSFSLISQQNTQMAFDRTTNDWDYKSRTGEHLLSELVLTCFHPTNTLNFASSSMTIELEFIRSDDHGAEDLHLTHSNRIQL